MHNGRKHYLTAKERKMVAMNLKMAASYCTPGAKHRFAKVVNGKCVRFGYPGSNINPDRKTQQAFCKRHACTQKRDPATPGYQSCKKWRCATG